MPLWQTRLWEKKINPIPTSFPNSFFIVPLFKVLDRFDPHSHCRSMDQDMAERAVELRRNPIVVIDAMEGNPAFLEFRYVTNPGAAWSLFQIIQKP